MPSVYSGNVNVSFYTSDQLRSGIGTLFGAHLRRDARIIWDKSGALGQLIFQMGEVETDRLLGRARDMCQVFGAPGLDLPKYLVGLVREARYLLRSCLYAQAIAAGSPCFSVREIAQRYQDPKLVTLLASRQTAEPKLSDLSDCLTRLEDILGPLPSNPHGSLEALIVNEWGRDGDLLSMAFMALGIVGGESDYAEVEKILL
jgi:hypothetical protein